MLIIVIHLDVMNLARTEEMSPAIRNRRTGPNIVPKLDAGANRDPGPGWFQFSDIRDEDGFKNVMIGNRNKPPNMALVDINLEAPFVAPEEAEEYLKNEYYSSEIRIAVHELLGHGTGNRLLREKEDGSCNFDHENPPTDPVTRQPVKTWYKGNETMSGIFGNLGQTLDECRADGVVLYLLSNKELLATFGYDDNSDLKPDDVIHNAYLTIAVHGFEALLSYDTESKEWSQAHERGFFLILRSLMAAPDFLHLELDKASRAVKVRLDRTNIMSVGRKTLGELLLKLHIWRVTANVAAFQGFLEEHSTVDKYWLGVREVVQARKINSWMFVQGNTFLTEDRQDVVLKEYEESPEGVIKSWAERTKDA